MPRPKPQKAAARPSALAPTLERRVLRYIREHALLARGERVLVGVSAGPDSSALLLILASLARPLRVELRAAYFDHQLRGPRASARERRAVEGLAGRADLPLVAGSGDVRAHARAGRLSLEEAARELRYRFLAQAARDAGCGVVAVGHTADDRVETVLLHILRGSGLKGLGGMVPRSPWPLPPAGDAPALVRPLLALTRQETEAYCREAGFTPLRDPSNRSPAFLRNRVRNQLLPLLRRYNPSVDAALLRLADAARADQELIENLAADALPATAGADGSLVRLPRQRLADLPQSLRLHVLRLAVERLLGDARDLGDRHLRAMAAAAGKPVGARIDLPRDLRLEVGYDEVVLSQGSAQKPSPFPAEDTPLAVPGRTVVGRWTFEVERAGRDDQPSSDPWEALVDASAVADGLWVRRRRRGDRFQPLGMSQEKKLQDFLVDERVPRAERDALPLVCAPKGIVWVVGYRLAEWAAVRPATSERLRLRARRPVG